MNIFVYLLIKLVLFIFVIMEKKDQQKRLKWFSRVGFFFPWIYLLRARRYIWGIAILIVPTILGYFIESNIFLFIISLIVGIIIGIKWRKMAFDTSKKKFEDFKKWYKKTSKIMLSILFSLLLIIFVGIFLAALLPRLSSVKWRANDVSRKADIQMVATALIAYKMDYKTYPQTWWSIDTIQYALKDSLLDIPSDPDQKASFSGYTNMVTTPGQYMYIPLDKKWNIIKWFALIAKTETKQTANRVLDKNIPLEKITKSISIKVCDTLTLWTSTKNMNDGSCSYKDTGDLAYIYSMWDIDTNK